MKQQPLRDVRAKSPTPSSVFNPKEYKVQVLRECPTPVQMQLCDTPEKVVAYWRSAVVNHPYLNPDVETLVVLLLNTRRRLQGHHLVATGTLDTILVHPREVFRVAVIGAARFGPDGETNQLPMSSDMLSVISTPITQSA